MRLKIYRAAESTASDATVINMFLVLEREKTCRINPSFVLTPFVKTTKVHIKLNLIRHLLSNLIFPHLGPIRTRVLRDDVVQFPPHHIRG